MTIIFILANLSLTTLAGSVEESLRNRREEGNDGEEKEVLEAGETVSEGGEKGARDKCAGVTCYNGDCVAEEEGGKGEGKCQCWHGWRGDQCELCGGRVRMTEEDSRSWLAEAAKKLHNKHEMHLACRSLQTWFQNTPSLERF